MYTRTQRPHRDWTRPVFESPVEVWVSSGLLQGQGLWSHRLSWRSPLTPPWSHQADDPQTAEQLCQRHSHTVKKVLGPTTDFPAWGSGEGTEKSQGIWFWRPVGFDYRTYIGLGKQMLWGHKQNFVSTRSQEKREVTPQKTGPDLPVSVQESSGVAWVSSGLLQGWGSKCDSACTGPFEGAHHYLHYFHHSLVPGQITGREQSPTHQQKIGLKIYWAWPPPSE